MIRALVALAVVFGALPARAAPRVTDVLGATSDVRAVAVDRGAILLGTSVGVVVVRDGHMAQTLGARDGLPGARVLSLTATEDGVWIGGVDGAALLARDGAAYRVARTQPIRRVTRVAEFAGMTYFATFGAGLLRAASSGTPERVAIGRDRTRVSDLVVVGDRLWIATIDDGVIRLAPSGKRDEVRGLPSEVVWDLEPEGDGVLAATAAGVAAISARGRARALRGLDEVPVRDVRAIARRRRHVDRDVRVGMRGASRTGARSGSTRRPRRARSRSPTVTRSSAPRAAPRATARPCSRPLACRRRMSRRSRAPSARCGSDRSRVASRVCKAVRSTYRPSSRRSIRAPTISRSRARRTASGCGSRPIAACGRTTAAPRRARCKQARSTSARCTSRPTVRCGSRRAGACCAATRMAGSRSPATPTRGSRMSTRSRPIARVVCGPRASTASSSSRPMAARRARIRLQAARCPSTGRLR